MQKKLLVVVLGTLFAIPAFAEDAPAAAAAAPTPAVTSNVALVSNYIYRGLTQSNANPAIQGGFDYAHSSGFYAGTWGSSITWVTDETAAQSSGVEIDTYVGFKNSFATDFSYDVGFLRYNYPAKYATTLPPIVGTTPYAKADTNEVYALIGWKWFTLKYSDSLGDTFTVPGAGGTSYIDLSASYAVGDSGYTLGAHYGAQTYTGSTATDMKNNSIDPTYTDYRVSVTKDLSGYTAGLTYTGTNVSDHGFYSTAWNKNTGASALTLSLARTF